MNIKDILQKAGVAVAAAVMFVCWFIWSFIKGIATVITFLIIFVLLSAIFPFALIEAVLLILLLWFIYTRRHKVATVIAVVIAFGLALMVFNSFKYSLVPDWVITKYSSYSSSFFRFHSLSRNFGLTEIKHEVLDTLTCYATADLDDVWVKGPLTVYGRLDADALKVQGKVKVYGRATLNDVDFKDDVSIYGKLNLDHGLISGETNVYGRATIEECHMKDLVVYTKKITLTSSTVKNIYMKKSAEKTTVKLVDSKVDGDIVFDGGNGKVILERGASVGGKIIGGTMAMR